MWSFTVNQNFNSACCNFVYSLKVTISREQGKNYCAVGFTIFPMKRGLLMLFSKISIK